MEEGGLRLGSLGQCCQSCCCFLIGIKRTCVVSGKVSWLFKHPKKCTERGGRTRSQEPEKIGHPNDEILILLANRCADLHVQWYPAAWRWSPARAPGWAGVRYKSWRSGASFSKLLVSMEMFYGPLNIFIWHSQQITTFTGGLEDTSKL